jgi:hypothetical protein
MTTDRLYNPGEPAKLTPLSPRPVAGLAVPGDRRKPEVFFDVRMNTEHWATPWTAACRVNARTPEDAQEALTRAYKAAMAQLDAAAAFAAQEDAQ